MNRESLDEEMKLAQKLFSLPPEVTSQQKVLPDGEIVYIFRHVSLGELGRILILPHPGNQTQFVCEVCGDEDDPMTQTRREMLEPVMHGILDMMEKTLGVGEGTSLPFSLQKEQSVVKSEIMPCHHCGAPTAMMIIVENAFTVDRLEDHARLMYAKFKELNIPTWIVGTEKKVCIDGEWMGESLVLKVWPKRELAKIMRSSELNQQLKELMQRHC